MIREKTVVLCSAVNVLENNLPCVRRLIWPLSILACSACAGEEFVSSTASVEQDEEEVSAVKTGTAGTPAAPAPTVADGPEAPVETQNSPAEDTDSGSGVAPNTASLLDAGATASLLDAGASDGGTVSLGAEVPNSNSGADASSIQATEAFLPVVHAEADQLRLDVPCNAPIPVSPSLCQVLPEHDVQSRVITLGGDPKETYALLVRVRGFVELADHLGGDRLGDHFRAGGEIKSVTHSAYRLTVTEPSSMYTLNARLEGTMRLAALDYTVSLQARGGASLTLGLNHGPSVVDGIQRGNPENVIVAGEGLGPQPYDGQFLQIDILSGESLSEFR